MALLKYVYENANYEDAYERVSWSLSAKALGDCYRLGKGVGKDEEKAVALYTEAAEDGNVGAKHILALRSWARGDGVDTLKWLGLSSSERQRLDSLSLALMGIIYSDSPFADVATDKKLAVKYFKLAAKEKNAYAMTETGDNYRLANNLKENPKEEYEFIGNVEGKDVLEGPMEVLVTDGYSGNVLMKGVEGAAKAMGHLLKKAFMTNISTKLGYLLAKKGMAGLKESLDPSSIGGAMLLGVKGVAVKAHGASDPKGFLSALSLASRMAEGGMAAELARLLS